MNILTVTYFLNGFLMLAVPIGLAIFLTRKWKIGWRIWWIGVATFILSQIGHIPFNALVAPVFSGAAFTSLSEGQQHLLISLFLGFSAGIFEEGARFLVLRFWAKDARSWRKGILFGAGHGGVEAIILGLLVLFAYIQMLILRSVPPDQLSQVVGADQLALAQAQINTYWSAAWPLTLLGAVERIFTIPCQIALAVLVLQAFTRKNLLWLLAAIGYHALLDFAAVFLQPSISVYALEGVVGLFSLASLGILFLLRTPEPEESAVESASHEVKVVDISPVEETTENLEKSKYQS